MIESTNSVSAEVDSFSFVSSAHPVLQISATLFFFMKNCLRTYGTEGHMKEGESVFSKERNRRSYKELFVLDLPVLAVYLIINMDEMLKLLAVWKHYKKYNWVKDLTVKEEV